MTALAPCVVASVLAGLGVYGVIARRNAMLVLVGLELILLAAGIVLVTAGALGPDTTASGNVLALAILVAAYRAQGHVDLERAGDA